MQKSLSITFSSSFSKNSSSRTNNAFSGTKFSNTYSTVTSKDHNSLHKQIKKERFNSFQLTNIQENCEKNHILHKITLLPEMRRGRSNLVTLDEVTTIKSFSPKSSLAFSQIPVEESIIIMKGCDLMDDKDQNIFSQIQQGNKTVKQNRKNRIEKKMRKIFNPKINLVQMVDTGMIAHYQRLKRERINVLFYEKVIHFSHENILTLYSVQKSPEHVILFFEPYSISFHQYLTELKNISSSFLIYFLIELIKIVRFTQNYNISASFDIQNLFLMNNILKIKLKPQNQENDLKKTSNFLKVGKQIVELTKKKAEQKQKVKQIEKLFSEIEEKDSILIEDIELKLQVLKYN